MEPVKSTKTTRIIRTILNYIFCVAIFLLAVAALSLIYCKRLRVDGYFETEFAATWYLFNIGTAFILISELIFEIKLKKRWAQICWHCMTFILSETGFYLSILVVMDKMVDRNDNLWSQSMDIVVMIIVFGYSITNSMQQLIMIYHSIFDTKKNVIFHVYLLRWSFIVIASILSFGVLPFFFSPSDPIAIQSVHIIFCFSIAAELTSTMVKGLQKTFSKRIPAIFFYFVHLALIIAGISMLGFTWLTFQLKQFDFTSYKQLIISDTMSFLFVASYITIFSIVRNVVLIQKINRKSTNVRNSVESII